MQFKDNYEKCALIGGWRNWLYLTLFSFSPTEYILIFFLTLSRLLYCQFNSCIAICIPSHHDLHFLDFMSNMRPNFIFLFQVAKCNYFSFSILYVISFVHIFKCFTIDRSLAVLSFSAFTNCINKFNFLQSLTVSAHIIYV